MNAQRERLEKWLWILAVAIWMPSDWHLLVPIAALLVEAARFWLEE